MKKLDVTEYLPKACVTGSRIIILLLIMGMAAILSGFYRNMQRIAEKEEKYIKLEQVLNQYEEWIEEGESSFAKGEYEEAKDYFLKAVTLHPKKTKAYIRLADIYEYHKNYEQAKAVLEACPEQIRDEEFQRKMLALEESMNEYGQSIFHEE